MHAVILQHHPIEGPGALSPWLAQHASSQQIVHLYDGEACPPPEDVDLLLILGGPMSVNDENDYPWLIFEKAFIRQVIDLDRPILGICLGGQLIACALGAKVRPNRLKEIGWFAIDSIAPPSSSITLPAMTVFQWHGETFDLPERATLLATSPSCAHQAFLYGEKVLALQFHPEVTPELVKLFVETGSDELIDEPCIQRPEAILGVSAELYRAGNSVMENLLQQIMI